jgi:hypothetical protein
MPTRKSKGQLFRIQPVDEDTSASSPARSSPNGTPLQQINFRCSADMARALIRGAEKSGGMRQYVAKLMKKAGVRDVPDWDTEKSGPYRQL